MAIHDKLDSQRNEIRLIRLLPGRASEPVKCTLYAVSLDDKPDYEALSYTWGDPNETRPIVVNDTEHQVTVNLFEALQELRHRFWSRTLWVDALCINQKDIPEKNEQVPKMGQVYRSARRVLAWLGPVTDRVIMTLVWLQVHGGQRRPLLMSLKVMSKAIQMRMRKYWWRFLPRVDQMVHLWQEIGAVLNVFEFVAHPYWTRMWTYQEFILPDREPICCYSKGLRFQMSSIFRENVWFKAKLAFFTAIKTVMQRPDLSVDELEKTHPAMRDRIMRWQDSSLATDRMRDVGQFSNISGSLLERNEKVKDMSNMLLETRGRQCIDPHDKIYALYGMLPAATAAAFPPDYAKPMRQVMLETTVLILHESNPIVLWAIIPPRPDRLTDDCYPSWVPEYDGRPGITDHSRAFAFTVERLQVRQGVPPLVVSPQMTTVTLCGCSVEKWNVILHVASDEDAAEKQVRDLVQQFGADHKLYLWLKEICRMLLPFDPDVTPVTTMIAALISGKTIFVTTGDIVCYGVGEAAMRDGDVLVVSPQIISPLVLRPQLPPDTTPEPPRVHCRLWRGFFSFH